MTDKKITFLPRELWQPLLARCDKTGEKPSQVIRLALAKLLKEPVPICKAGRPERRDED